MNKENQAVPKTTAEPPASAAGRIVLLTSVVSFTATYYKVCEKKDKNEVTR